MKKLTLLSLSALTLAMGASAFISHASISTNSDMETSAWAGDKTIVLHGTMTGAGSWSNHLTLTYHGDASQYEGVIYLPKGARFGFSLTDNWIGYHSKLPADFSSASGGNGGDIVVENSGVYQIYISAKIEDYSEPDTGYWIWNETSYSSSMIRLGDTPVIFGCFDGETWGDSDATFTWDAESHRYKATKHLVKGNKIKIHNGTKYMGYRDVLDGNFFFGSATGGNIEILKTGTYSFFLGASYWFYDDQAWSWNNKPAWDDSEQRYYYSYANVLVSDEDVVDDFVAEYITAKSGDPAVGDSCEDKYETAKSALEGLSPTQQELFEDGAKYSSARSVYQYWLDHKDDSKLALVVPSKTEASMPAVTIGLVALGTVIAIGGFLFLRKRKQD